MLDEEKVAHVEDNDSQTEYKLDDERRVKIVSPGMLVAKRFFRNKLALFGLGTIIALFLFCFVGPLFYPYSEDQVFNTYKSMPFDYATVNFKASADNYYLVPENTLSLEIKNLANSQIIAYETNGYTGEKVYKNGVTVFSDYYIEKKDDDIYVTKFKGKVNVATFSKKTETIGSYGVDEDNDLVFTALDGYTISPALRTFLGTLSFNTAKLNSDDGNTYTLSGNKKAGTIMRKTGEYFPFKANADVADALVTYAQTQLGNDTFTYESVNYNIDFANDIYTVSTPNEYDAFISTKLVFNYFADFTDVDAKDKNSFEAQAYDAYIRSQPSFTYKDSSYKLVKDGSSYNLQKDISGTFTNVGVVNDFAARRYNGEDTISIDIKNQMKTVVTKMINENLLESECEIYCKKTDIDENGVLFVVTDDAGNAVFENKPFTIFVKNGNYVFKTETKKYVADANAAPSAEHIMGLDGAGMDNFARIMYGGRVSLCIGFIVTFIEITIGAILGGISGYFGGWVDNLIMRIVDVFYCIPSTPILIIFGAMFDSLNLGNIVRVIWMMIIIGILGWPGIARLVRGQILSLREQDFMVAAESSGLSTKRKIFKHLIPNVMPQLIVEATMGLGSVILTESTLSYLGLGVKFPMATWGSIINSVSSITGMQTYTYVWIPCGCLICLAVIAFNFIGDGLRDAFDPKMKR